MIKKKLLVAGGTAILACSSFGTSIFTGKSINGEVGAQANTSNEDIVIPATNREAAQTYGAQAGDGLQGYGLRVLYTKK